MTNTRLRPITFTLPASWASYLINGDASGLEGDEQDQADTFLDEAKLGTPVDCEDDGFRWFNDANHLGGSAALGQDCALYTFLVPSDYWQTYGIYPTTTED